MSTQEIGIKRQVDRETENEQKASWEKSFVSVINKDFIRHDYKSWNEVSQSQRRPLLAPIPGWKQGVNPR